jgi:hypothetical protein
LDANDWRCPTRDWEKILDEESSAEGAAQNRFERFTIQSSDFAEGQ